MQFTLPNLKLSTPLPAKVAHPSTCNLVCKTHAEVIAITARRWLVHLCGRASPHMLARAAAS
eukprot:2719740-Pyramimonas_sp.AAC.1